jgi:hypothetical protein
VYRSVQRAVHWGLAHRNLEGIEAIGVDEVQWQKGHHYLTLVYQIDGQCRRLLHIAPERLILNWFTAKGTISAGIVEGLNYNVKLTRKKVVWLPYSGGGENRLISPPRRPSRAGIRPQILVRRLFCKHRIEADKRLWQTVVVCGAWQGGFQRPRCFVEIL